MPGKYPSEVEIAEMRARGFDPHAIAQAEIQARRGPQMKELCLAIEKAFSNVRLGKGVGLIEAQGRDDYADAKTCAAYRAKDEKEDWRRISAEALNQCYSSLSFFDAEGMRFHLPAYLIAYLQDSFKGEIMFTLTHLSDYSTNQFSSLSDVQRAAVRAFLAFHLGDPNFKIHHADIERALNEYWCKPS